MNRFYVRVLLEAQEQLSRQLNDECGQQEYTGHADKHAHQKLERLRVIETIEELRRHSHVVTAEIIANTNYEYVMEGPRP